MASPKLAPSRLRHSRSTPGSGRSGLCLYTAAFVQVFGCLHDEAIHAHQQQASEKRRGTKSRGAGRCGGSNLSAGYGDLKRGLAAASVQRSCANGYLSPFGRRAGRKRGVGMLPAGVDGGEFELPRSLSRRAPAWLGQAQRQSRPILRFGNCKNGVMTCRSRLAL
jgi:hypothetical protein